MNCPEKALVGALRVGGVLLLTAVIPAVLAGQTAHRHEGGR